MDVIAADIIIRFRPDGVAEYCVNGMMADPNGRDMVCTVCVEHLEDDGTFQGYTWVDSLE